jgi:C4-dicarboxylate-specific signal transduction histidine kinase
VIPAGYLVALALLLALGAEYSGYLLVNTAFTLANALLAFHALRLLQQARRLGAALIAFGFSAAVIGNVGRLYGVLSSVTTPNPLANTWDVWLVGASLLVAALSINFGFFAYALERDAEARAELRHQRMQAETERDQAHQHVDELDALVRERDEMLRLAAHVSRLGTLDPITAGIAHEVNQPLAAARLNLDVLRDILARDAIDRAEAVRYVEETSRQIVRTAGVVHRIRAIIAQQSIELSAVALEQVWMAAVASLSHEVERCEVSLHVVPAAEQVIVQGDPVLMQQVFVNILLNSIEALATRASGPRRIEMTYDCHGGMVRVVVDDNGPGMTGSRMEQVFEPFVTSKPDGCGLGLPISQAIMRRFGGAIELATGPLGGLRVMLSFRPVT